jgi:hypothetical protein
MKAALNMRTPRLNIHGPAREQRQGQSRSKSCHVALESRLRDAIRHGRIEVCLEHGAQIISILLYGNKSTWVAFIRLFMVLAAKHIADPNVALLLEPFLESLTSIHASMGQVGFTSPPVNATSVAIFGICSVLGNSRRTTQSSLSVATVLLEYVFDNPAMSFLHATGEPLSPLGFSYASSLLPAGSLLFSKEHKNKTGTLNKAGKKCVGAVWRNIFKAIGVTLQNTGSESFLTDTTTKSQVFSHIAPIYNFWKKHSKHKEQYLWLIQAMLIVLHPETPCGPTATPMAPDDAAALFWKYRTTPSSTGKPTGAVVDSAVATEEIDLREVDLVPKSWTAFHLAQNRCRSGCLAKMQKQPNTKKQQSFLVSTLAQVQQTRVGVPHTNTRTQQEKKESEQPKATKKSRGKRKIADTNL